MAEQIEKEKRYQESIRLCLMLAEKGNQFMIEKENHINQIKHKDTINSNKEAEKLKLELLKSKKTYKTASYMKKISQNHDLN